MHPLANNLLTAYDNAILIERPTASAPFSIADAYAIQAELTLLRRARGEPTIGRKIGFTNRAIWPDYGVDRPLWAHVYATTVQHAGNGQASLQIGRMVAPRIEPEIVLGLATIPALDADEPAIAQCLAWIAPGFELVDCHYADWAFTSAECAADFGLHAALIIGTPLDVRTSNPTALAAALRSCQLTLSCDGQPVAQGRGSNVLDSPLLALRYLIETLAVQEGQPLQPGEIITTGTITPAMPIHAGQRWRWACSGIALDTLDLELHT